MEIAIAILSLIISVFTLWATYLHSGRVKMTRPTTIFFGPDGKDGDEPKVFLRTLLFSTSQKGKVIESMHLKLYRGESVQTFNIWIYGERKELVRGSGLYVGKEGVSYNHHFLLPKDGSTYEFVSGKYRLEIFASLLNKSAIKMFSVELEVSETQAARLKESRYGLFFDWGPESNRYQPHLRFEELTQEELFKKVM